MSAVLLMCVSLVYGVLYRFGFHRLATRRMNGSLLGLFLFGMVLNGLTVALLFVEMLGHEAGGELIIAGLVQLTIIESWAFVTTLPVLMPRPPGARIDRPPYHWYAGAVLVLAAGGSVVYTSVVEAGREVLPAVVVLSVSLSAWWAWQSKRFQDQRGGLSDGSDR